MPLRPRVDGKYRTVTGLTVRITEDLGKTLTVGGYVFLQSPHYSVWNLDGENQEDVNYDLDKEIMDAPRNN